MHRAGVLPISLVSIYIYYFVYLSIRVLKFPCVCLVTPASSVSASAGAYRERAVGRALETFQCSARARAPAEHPRTWFVFRAGASAGDERECTRAAFERDH